MMEEDGGSPKCVHCGKSYSTKRNLLKHLRVVHKLKREKNIKTVCQCDICGKVFASVSACNRHQNLKHTNVSPQRSRQSSRKCPKLSNSQELHSEKETSNVIEDLGPSVVCQTSTSSPASKRKISSSNQSDQKEKIQCKECLTTFIKKSSLKRHSTRCKGLIGTALKVKSCPFSDSCQFQCSLKKDLTHHLKECHSTEPDVLSDLKCGQCSIIFASHSSLKRHLRKCGKKELIVTLKPCTYSEDCQFKYRFKSALRSHLQNFHKCNIKQPQTFHFNTYRDFLLWKETEEDSSWSYFSAQTGMKNNKRIFYCQRDGSGVPHKKRSSNLIRARKSGRMKTGAVCHASMCCTFKDDNSVSVLYFPTHSHPLQADDIKNHPLPPLAVKEVNEKLSLGACPSEIENFLKGGAPAYENSDSDGCIKLTRRSRHQLKSIKERQRRHKMKLKFCSDDATAFEKIKVEEQNEDLIYKPEGVECSNNSRDCFMIDIGSQEQAEVMNDEANIVLVVDDMHGCSQYMNVVVPDSVDPASGHASNFRQEIISLCNDIISLTREDTVKSNLLSHAAQTLQSLKDELVHSVKAHEDMHVAGMQPAVMFTQSEKLQKQMIPFRKPSIKEDSSSKKILFKYSDASQEESLQENLMTNVQDARIESIVTSILTINVPSQSIDIPTLTQSDSIVPVIVPSQALAPTQIIDLPYPSVVSNRTITVPSQSIEGAVTV